MIQRCHNPNSKVYCWYGERGIQVCDRWRSSFEAFFADMGPRPPGLMIERIDNAKGYEPGNCEWATRRTQMRNTRYTRLVDVDGERLCIRDAAIKIGVPEGRIYWRVWKLKISHQESFDYCRALGAILGGQGGG